MKNKLLAILFTIITFIGIAGLLYIIFLQPLIFIISTVLVLTLLIIIDGFNNIIYPIYDFFYYLLEPEKD